MFTTLRIKTGNYDGIPKVYSHHLTSWVSTPLVFVLLFIELLSYLTYYLVILKIVSKHNLNPSLHQKTNNITIR